MTTTGTDDPLLLAAACTHGAVAVVGDVSRTWYRDYDLLVTTLEALELFSGVALTVCHAQQLPFDDHVERAAEKLGFVVSRSWAPIDRMKRIASVYDRHPGMLERATLLIAFPREDSDVTSADSGVVLTALEAGIPVLCVRREGMEFFAAA